MKCIIPCAGYATRLWPLTKDKPKTLLDVKGKPILEYIIKKVKEIKEVDEIFIVVNDKFYSNLDEWLKNFECDIPIKLFNDRTTSNENRLGQIGDINFAIEQGDADDDLLVVAGDNLFNFSLKQSYEFFRKKRAMVNPLYDAKSLKVAQEQGNASVDKNNRIVYFEEKPKKPKSTYISLGIYYFPKDRVKLIKEYLDEGNNPDKIGYFWIWAIKKYEVYGYVYNEKWFDIGWPESLEQTRKEFDADF